MAMNWAYESASIGGTGRKDLFAEWNYTVAQLRGVGKGPLGSISPLRGNLYQIVQNRFGGDLNKGDVVSLAIAEASRIGNLTGASLTYQLVTDDTHDSGLAGNDGWPGVIGVTAGAFATADVDEQLRQIYNNTPAAGASSVDITPLNVTGSDYIDGPTNGAPTTNPDVIATPGATYDYEVFCPYEVVKTDSDAKLTTVPHGVVMSTTITDNQCGVIQVGGIALAKVDGTTDLVAGDYLATDAGAGVLSKYVATTVDPTLTQIEQLMGIFGRILGAYTNNGVRLRAILIQPTMKQLLPAQDYLW